VKGADESGGTAESGVAASTGGVAESGVAASTGGVALSVTEAASAPPSEVAGVLEQAAAPRRESTQAIESERTRVFFT
jgi:hypothetical protein